MIYKFLMLCYLSLFAFNTYADQDLVKTRYGQFQIKASDEYPQGALYFEHKLVKPVISGNNSLAIEGIYTLSTDDLLLVQDIGGSGCPLTLYFVKISLSKNIRVSPAFGSCSDLIKVSVKPKKIIITMPDFIGASETEQQDRAVAKHKMTYIYDGNLVTENGKAMKN